MTIKEAIKKSFFDILPPPPNGKEASPNLLNVPTYNYTIRLYAKSID